MRVVFVGRDRVVWRRIVLSLLTLGVSRRIWLYRVGKEVDGHDQLGIDHGRRALLLSLAGVGAAMFLFFAVLPTVALVVAGAFFVPTWLVAIQTARHGRAMMLNAVPYGPTWVWCGIYLVPIVGPLAFMAWHQRCLNRYWTLERQHPEHGIDIDVDEREPAFLLALEAARRQSYAAGSRFDEARERRRTRWRQRAARFHNVRAQRMAVRARGGSTPILPFLAPRTPRLPRLHVTCGQCAHTFMLLHDPLLETPIVCPSCGRTEVLPGAASDPLAPRDAAAVPVLRARCAGCKKTFHAARALAIDTPLECPHCGRQGVAPRPA